MNNKYYPHLFSPIKIKNLHFPNRVMIAPLGNSHDDACKDYAKTGASIMTLGSWQVDDEWSMLMGYKSPYAKRKGTFVHEKSGKKELQKCMYDLQKYGMYASIELIHAGRYAHNYTDKCREGRAIGPYTEAYPHKKGYDVQVIGMDKGMIEHVADNYAKAAKFHKELGFDMIMLHFAHGWLPWQFLSPTYNKRTDEYGGSLENRMKFPKLIIEKVREAVGNDFPIELRIGGEEFREGGFNINECIEFVKSVEHLIDIVHVSGGLDSEPDTVHFMMSGNLHSHCDKLHLAAEVKKHVNIPVCAVGSFMYPDEAEEAIASGKCDLVAIGRSIMVDLDWVHKARAGRSYEILPCLRCTVCKANTAGCASNPRRSDKTIPSILPLTNESKKLVIIGGGPAGIRSAITGAQRGHQVTLFEKTNRLGGQIKNFENDPYKVDLARFNQQLVGQINQYKEQIDIRLNHEPDREAIKSLNPDMILIAIGAKPILPNIHGVKSYNVIQAIDVYEHPEKVQGKTVIIGGGPTGIETALYLDDLGHECTVIEMTNKYYTESSSFLATGTYEIDWVLKQHPNIKICLNSRVKEIREKSIIYIQEEKETKIIADTVVLAVGLKPDQNEIDKYYGICYDTYLIGDCRKARTLAEATNEAFYRVMEL